MPGAENEMLAEELLAPLAFEAESEERSRVDEESWTPAFAADAAESGWHAGDFGLAAFLCLCGTVLIGVTLAPGVEVARAARCKESVGCTYTYDMAVGGTPLPVPIAAAAAGNEQSCCDSCCDTLGCVVATYLNATGACLLYATDTRVVFKGAAVCALAETDVTDPVDATRRLIQNLLGASAVFARFGGFVVVYFLNKLQGLIGYAGASLAQSILKPREAAITSSALSTAQFARQGRLQPSGLSAASWGAIADPGDTPPMTWTEARRGLGLSIRQALWSCGMRLLLWHWVQPLSYFCVFAAYYCALPECNGRGYLTYQRQLGLVVAVREAVYLTNTGLALWVNPAFLLLELGDLSFKNSEAVKQWSLYVLAPHHYVTLCLLRWADGTVRSLPAGYALRAIGIFQLLADLASVTVLEDMLSDPGRPTALVIGYWLTTLGLVAGGTGLGLLMLGEAWTARNSLTGAGVGSCRRVVFGSVGALCMAYACAVGLQFVVQTPLILVGVLGRAYDLQDAADGSNWFGPSHWHTVAELVTANPVDWGRC